MKRLACYILILSFLIMGCDKGGGTISDYHSDTYPGNPANPGHAANNFLRATTYKSLIIEIQYMPGYKPDQRALDLFLDLVRERVNKPNGVFIRQTEINPTFIDKLTLSDLVSIEARNRTVMTGGDQLTAYILFTSGSWYNNANALGLTYDNNSICIFGEPLKYFLFGSVEDKAKLIAYLLAHEFGHLFGLVNMGSPMVSNHEDNANPNHCNNINCIMHHTLEGNKTNYEKLLSSRTELANPAFDDNCIRDIQANGGK